MSFYTTLSFYHSTTPPKLTGADLAAFVSMFGSLGLSKPGEGTVSYGIKFGQSIDQDDEPISVDDPPINGISVVNFPTYDAEGQLESLAELAEALKSIDGTIYRASLSLGLVSDSIFDAVCRQPSEENDIPLQINHWGLEIGPILSYSLGSDEIYMVGLIAVNLNGYGYLYPWTFRELIDRVEAVSPIAGLMEGCRRLWPIAPREPEPEVIEARQRMGELWPYPRADLPWDWFWALGESG